MFVQSIIALNSNNLYEYIADLQHGVKSGEADPQLYVVIRNYYSGFFFSAGDQFQGFIHAGKAFFHGAAPPDPRNSI